MAMEVLRPQDCLTANRFRSHAADVYPRRRSFTTTTTTTTGNNGRSGRKQPAAPRSDRKRQNGEPRRSKSEENLRHNNNNNNLISGHVTILRRGESLDSKMNSLKKRIERNEMNSRSPFLYAGSAFVVSPAPSDLPLPSFSKKALTLSSSVPNDDSATRDLRRLLRLE